MCIVTGATAGIGQAIAELFAEHGAKVVVSGRNVENGTAVVQGIGKAGNESTFVRADLSRDSECESLIRTSVERYGKLDILINNAAAIDQLAGYESDAVNLPPDSWDYQMRVNLRAVYFLSRLAIPLMRQQGGGRIVNISSVGSVVGWPGAAAYLTSKGGLNQLTRSMAIDYSADNIRVNALCPGWIMTQTEQVRIDKDPGLVERTCERMGLQRMGTPREMAFATLFLASEESSYVTGAALVADGGWTLR